MVDYDTILSLLKTAGLVALHTSVLYLSVILMVRLLAPRQISELTIAELVVIMILGSSIETAMIAGDTSLFAGLVSASTLLVCNRSISVLIARSKRFKHLLVGRPVTLVVNGRLLRSRLRTIGLTEEDVLEGIRKRGYDNIDQVRCATREIDGVISVVPRETSPSSES